MFREILLASDEAGKSAKYILEVFQEGDHWASTLARCDENGSPRQEAAAPRFYGMTQEQARRRMIAVLENQYDRVEAIERESV